MTVAFVAGATGYTGQKLVPLLVARGVKTYAHVRPDSNRLEAWRARFEGEGAIVDSTSWSVREMTETLTRIAPTHVFALLGTTRARSRTDRVGAAPADYEAVDYGLTSFLLQAARASGHRPRFIYLSSVGVGPRARAPYLAVRWRLEQELTESGLPFAIARPSFITGPDREEDRPLERVGAKIAEAGLKVAKVFGARQLAERYRSTDARGLAEGLARIAFDVDASRVFESEELRVSRSSA